MKYFFLFLSFSFATMLAGQEMPSYHMYTIEAFAKKYFRDSVKFYKSYAGASSYPKAALDDNIEGIVEVLLINHSDSSFQTFITDPDDHLFLSNIHETLRKTRKDWLHTNVPFMLKFCVNYDLISGTENRSDLVSTCKLLVTAYRLQELRDTAYIYNLNDIAYQPQIIAYPYFRKPKKIGTQHHRIESIEELLEEAVKACCHKGIQFKPLPPIPSHAQGIYTEPKGFLRLLFHSTGYISKVQLFGKLAYKLDAEALHNKLKSVQFKPALLENKPVHVALDFQME